MPGDDYPAHNRRRRVDRDITGRDLAHTLLDIDLAIGTEVAAALAGDRIDLDDPRVERPFDDARCASRARHRAGNSIITHTATRRRIGDRLVGHFRVEPPTLRAAA